MHLFFHWKRGRGDPRNTPKSAPAQWPWNHMWELHSKYSEQSTWNALLYIYNVHMWFQQDAGWYHGNGAFLTTFYFVKIGPVWLPCRPSRFVNGILIHSEKSHYRDSSIIILLDLFKIIYLASAKALNTSLSDLPKIIGFYGNGLLSIISVIPYIAWDSLDNVPRLVPIEYQVNLINEGIKY